MSQSVTVDLGYRPRPLQADIHRSLKRWNVLVCHRRFGKTVLCIAELIDKALRCDKDRPRFAYLAPLYKQAKQAAWDYLKSYALKIPGATAHETELRVDLPGDRRVQLFGADNPDALRGMYLDGVVLDEYAQMPPKVWSEVVRPMLSDRQGWAIFIGTPMGRNEFCRLFEMTKAEPGWYGALYKASATKVLLDEELRDAKRQMSEPQYAQEYECSFEAAIAGAYYGTLMAQADADGRICGVPHDPIPQVETWWDLGIGDPTAIWFVQRVGREIHAIDYYEASGEPVSHYLGVLDQKRRERGYIYGKVILPWDAGGREITSGKSMAQLVKEARYDIEIMPGAQPAHSIEEARRIIPLTWFDKTKCARGIEALRQYRSDWDDSRQAFANRPYHDWTSHAANAFEAGAKYKPVHGAFSKPIEYPKNHVSRGFA